MAGKKYDLVHKVEIGNRHSAVYFFVTVIFALVVVELIHFLVRLEPLEGGPYYQIHFHGELLPQVIALLGSVYLLFDSYRRIVLLFRESTVGKILTVVLKFLVLLAIYVFAFVKPNYWVFLIGFTVGVNFLKNVQLYFSLRGNLKRNKIETKPSSVSLKRVVQKWMVYSAIYGALIITVGLVVYAPIMEAVRNYEVNFWILHVSPEVINWVALLTFICLAGAVYYYAPLKEDKPLFCTKRMDDLKKDLQNLYSMGL